MLFRLIEMCNLMPLIEYPVKHTQIGTCIYPKEGAYENTHCLFAFTMFDNVCLPLFVAFVQSRLTDFSDYRTESEIEFTQV